MLAENAGKGMDWSKARVPHDWGGQVQVAGKETKIEFHVTENRSGSGVRKRMPLDFPDGVEHPDLYLILRQPRPKHHIEIPGNGASSCVPDPVLKTLSLCLFE
jgi:hypothetical protein